MRLHLRKLVEDIEDIASVSIAAGEPRWVDRSMPVDH
jgi:hypothetical protein